MGDTTPDLSRLTIRRDDDAPRGARSRPRWLLPVLAAALAIVLAAVFLGRRGHAVDVRTSLAEFAGGAGGGGSVLTANGYVVARTQASVASKIMGRLEHLDVIEGTPVRKGDILAQLDDRDYAAALEQARAGAAAAEAALAEAEAARDQLRRDVDRNRQLLANTVISQREFEASESELAAAEARVG